MTNRVANALFALLLVAFAILHLYRLGVISPTWDEGGDAAIVDCIQRLRDPFACTGDISQTRLPFYIHALAGPAYGDERPHYLVSFVFSLLTFLMTYGYARRRFGAAIATLTAALFVTSPQLLASGRMLLTHSNIIFAFFSTASFLAMFEYAENGRRRWLIVCALASGLAAASHPLALFNGLGLAGVYLAARRYAWRDLVYFPIAAAAFFASSVIYIKPENFRALVDACLLGFVYPFWNYFGTGSTSAPWWFPFVILVVKIGPWWLVLAAVCVFRARLEKTLIAFTAALFIDLLLKGAVFHYETPHHQVQFYPVLCLVIAALIVRAWRPSVAIAVAAAFAIQTWDVIRFFPNYLFYGSQYGERFIGEFYGPAVMHAQDKDPVNREIDRILAAEPQARILVADTNALERADPRIIPFSKRDPRQRYEYAFVDRLYATHFRFPERDAFNAYVAANYVPHYTYDFPPHVWMYRVMRRR